MKRIAIYQANLKVGGIQRSLVNLLLSDILDDYAVDVFLFSEEVFFDLKEVSANITVHYLQPFPYWTRFVPFNLLKKMFCKLEVNDIYDYVIDFDSYRQDCAVYASAYKKATKIMWVHSDLAKEYKYNRKYRVLYQFFKGKYKWFDEFVAVSEGIVEPFRERSRQCEKRIIIIPNVINTKEIFDKSALSTNVKVDSRNYNMVCVGRLYVAKGYDFLLEDFRKAYQKRNDLKLYIIGDGPDLYRYKKWCKANKLTRAVIFLGNQKNPFCILKQMDAFCIESRYEGQGMVLMEAKALGLKLIFPERLEKYNVGLQGTDDVVGMMISGKKEEKAYNDLNDYMEFIRAQYKLLFDQQNKKVKGNDN